MIELDKKPQQFLSTNDENEILEYKEAKNQYDFDKIGKYFSALSNEANLLGKSESEYLLSPAVAQISWILKDKDNIAKDYEHFTCPFILSLEAVYNKIRNLKIIYLFMGQNKTYPSPASGRELSKLYAR